MMKYICLFLFVALVFWGCDLADSSAALQGNAVSGSITKFKVAGDVLYVIDGTTLRVFDLADPAHPSDVGTVEIGFGPETLFHLGDVLFVGAQTGMYMYSLENRRSPDLISHYEHVLSCDPVVANAERAYVTLRSGNACRGQGISLANELHVLDISNRAYPNLLSAMQMDHPKGLALDDDLLFVCDGSVGVKVFRLDNNGLPTQIALIPNLEAFDVIALDGRLIVVTKRLILQYDYTSPESIRLMSSIEHGV